MRRITIAQKNILIVAISGLVAFILALVFIYLPAKNEIELLKLDLIETENQITQIESIGDKTKSIEERLASIKGKYEKLNIKFSEKEEEPLRLLSELARALKLEVVSTIPRPKEIFIDGNGAKVVAEGKELKKVLVSLSVKGKYKALVDYLHSLNETLPAYFTVEKLIINKKDQQTGNLDITIVLNLYLLS
jgi:hypothetical protein